MDPFNQDKDLQYGLSIFDILLPGEDPAPFENLLDQFELDHKPATATEVVMVHDLVKFHWLMNRAIVRQQEALADPQKTDAKLLDQMTRQVNANNRNFLSTLNSLKAIQKARRTRENEQDEFVPLKEIIFPKYPGLGRDGYKLVPGVNDHYEDIEGDEEDEEENKEPPRVFKRPPGKIA
jgi:hypothetical protein